MLWEALWKKPCIGFHQGFQTPPNNKSTQAKRPLAFICFSVFETPDETLPLIVNILPLDCYKLHKIWCHCVNYVIAHILFFYVIFLLFHIIIIYSFIHFLEDISKFATLNSMGNNSYCIVLYCIVLYCIVLYCIVLYCIVLYCIVLYCIVDFLRRGLQETISALVYFQTNWQLSLVGLPKLRQRFSWPITAWQISQAVINICVPVKLVIRSRAAEQGEWTEHLAMQFFSLLRWWCVLLCFYCRVTSSFPSLNWSQKGEDLFTSQTQTIFWYFPEY